MNKRKLVQILLFIFMFIGCYFCAKAQSLPPAESQDIKASTILSAILLFVSIGGTIFNLFVGSKLNKARNEMREETKAMLLEKTIQIDKHLENSDNNIKLLEEKYNNTRVDIVERIGNAKEEIVDKINILSVKMAEIAKKD